MELQVVLKYQYWDFGFAQVEMIGYQAQVIPAILAGFVLAYLELGLRRVIPNVISMIFVPFFALIPAVLIAHVVLGPIGWTIGSWISNVVYSGLTSAFGWLFAAVIRICLCTISYHWSSSHDKCN